MAMTHSQQQTKIHSEMCSFKRVCTVMIVRRKFSTYMCLCVSVNKLWNFIAKILCSERNACDYSCVCWSEWDLFCFKLRFINAVTRVTKCVPFDFVISTFSLLQKQKDIAVFAHRLIFQKKIFYTLSPISTNTQKRKRQWVWRLNQSNIERFL